MEKLYYTMSEVSFILHEKDTTVRFWSNNFNRFLSPKRNAKGNRLYTREEIEILKKIKYLVREQGLSLDAAARKLRSGEEGEDNTLLIRDTLLRIRNRLEQIKNSL